MEREGAARIAIEGAMQQMGQQGHDPLEHWASPEITASGTSSDAPTSRQAGMTSTSISRLKIMYSDCTAAIG